MRFQGLETRSRYLAAAVEFDLLGATPSLLSMALSSLWSALLGGAVLGAGASLLLVLNGRIAGVSGIVGGLLSRDAREERSWRAFFVVGLLLGGLALLVTKPEVFAAPARPLWVVAISGLLVGVGTRIGGGCTSGHGVCGLARGSRRSLIATLLFVATAMLVAFASHWVGSR